MTLADCAFPKAAGEIACPAHAPYDWSNADLAGYEFYMDEQMGRKPKRWLRFSDDMQARPWLSKEVRGIDGAERGEDWAECLVHVVAKLLDIPSACIAPADWEGRRGRRRP